MDDGHFWTVHGGTREITNITEGAAGSFINYESDQTSKVYPDELQKPPFGVAGWTTDDAGVLLYDEYDIWVVATDGSGAERLTDGSAEEIRHRLVRPELAVQSRWAPPDFDSREEEWIDLDQPIYLSIYGEWTKKSGFFELDGDRLNELVFQDRRFGGLRKAKDADRVVFTASTFSDFPDYWTSDLEFRNPRRITDANPHQDEYRWGSRILVDFENKDGVRLQATLAIPDGYQAGQQLPMIVNFYENKSQDLLAYYSPIFGCSYPA